MNLFCRVKRVFLFLFVAGISPVLAQTTGQVMFTAFNADGNDGFSFVTFVDLPNGTAIRFNDNEWNGLAIGSGGAFNTGEGSLTWTNSTGSTIFAGTVITINNSATTPAASVGSAAGGTIALDDADEVLYMFLGTNATTPTTFLCAIANDGFSVTNGSINQTGLTPTSAISITGDQDVMIYTGSINCTTTITNCASAIATASSWVTQNTAANDAANGYPDFPANVPCNFYGVAFTVVTYYSRNATSGGAWDDNTSWTTNSDGSGGPLATGVWPRRHDHVVILPGHTITVNATNDNKSCGVTPDALLRSNVGPFAFSNIAMFYHIGDITIRGSFVVTGIETMLEGYTHLVTGGSFSPTSFLVNTGYLEVDAGTTLTGFNSLVLTGNSITIINTNSSFVDDLIIDHTDATLCGTGSAQLQNGAGSVVTTTNSGSLNQICSTFTITCSGAGCSGFPVTGMGGAPTGNSGPGGVGDLRDNVLWLKANSGTSTTTNGVAVSAWNDQSGNTNHATQATVANRPLYQSNIINGYPTLLFDNASSPNNDLLQISDNDNLDNTGGLTILSVFRPVNLNGDARAVVSKRTAAGTDQAYTEFLYTGNTMYIDIDGNGNRFNSTGTFANGTSYLTGLSFDGSLASAQRVRFYINGALDITATETSTVIPNSPANVTIGSMNLGDGRAFGGHIAEVAIYRRTLNEAQRIITNNYLSAKYNIAIPAAIDLYTMDNSGNGNFDNEVAGVGQASDGSNHKDAKGEGMVRMVIQSPSSLDNGEFLIWGHNGQQPWQNLVDVDGVIIRERLRRIWRVSEVGDVGVTAISFDINSLGTNPIGSNLRLLIDRDGDGFADNDVTPIGGGTYSGKIITFSGINLQNGDRFTLGNTDLANPLPVELLSFTATPMNNFVQLNWSTASETNNDYFQVQRSQDSESWEEVTEVKGAGTSTSHLTYSASDFNAYSGVSYYRLKQVDVDGKFSYSHIRRVELTKSLTLQVYPNPSTGSFYVSTGFEIEPADVRLLDMLGREVRATLRAEENGLLLEADQPTPGVYLIQVQKGFWKQSVRVIIKP